MREALLEQIERALDALLRESGEAGGSPPIALEPPRQKQHGDFACNAALILAKRLDRPPRELAQRLVDLLGDAGGLVARAEVAGPGFVNLWLAEIRWHDVLRRILVEGEGYGRSEAGAGRKVQVEFVSANPTGPLTLGHGRQAALGDCIGRLLEATGHRVTREYYFNDGGRQMRVLGESVRARYLEQLGLAAPPPAEWFEDAEARWQERLDGLPVVFPRDGYRGAYIGAIATGRLEEHDRAYVDEPGDGVFRVHAEEKIFRQIRETLAKLGIGFDVFFSETSLHEEGKLEEVLNDLRAADLAYDADEAVWLRATAWGLDRDRVLLKRTGEPTYLLPDIAYHREKFRRGFDGVIDVLGADHIEQFPFVRDAVRALGCDASRIELVMHQFVTLTRGGEQVKQSTRRATFVTVDELLDEVGVDVFRFFMVERKAEAHLDFDLDLAKDRNWKKNPTYYVQYAHARSHGIERTAREEGAELSDPEGFDAGRLELPEEIELIRKLGAFPEGVARAAETREPHHIVYYLRELAGMWNPYLQDGKRHRVVSEDRELSLARLALTRAVRTVLANGLTLLGISAPEKM